MLCRKAGIDSQPILVFSQFSCEEHYILWRACAMKRPQMREEENNAILYHFYDPVVGKNSWLIRNASSINLKFSKLYLENSV